MFDENRANYAIEFIQNLKHTKGKWAGKPFKLFPWEYEIIKDVYGSVLYSDDLDELDYSYTFQLDEEDFSSMYSIELIYGDRHLYGYFVSGD